MTQAVRRDSATAVSGREVFIVHGHDRTRVHEAVRFLEKLELKPIVLDEKPNEGKTIIEKFAQHADQCCFAVVFLTPDDRGGPAGEDVDSLRPRARQNAILELGYFLAKLGREKVCVVYSPGVEIPSDYSGVLWIELNSAWRFQVAAEIKNAGITVDLNKLG